MVLLGWAKLTRFKMLRVVTEPEQILRVLLVKCLSHSSAQAILAVKIYLPGTILKEYRRLDSKWWYLGKGRILQHFFLLLCGWCLHGASPTLLTRVLSILGIGVVLGIFLWLWQLGGWYTIIVIVWESPTKKVFWIIAIGMVAHTTTGSLVEARTLTGMRILAHFTFLWLLSGGHEIRLISSRKSILNDFGLRVVETDAHLLHHFDILINERLPARLRSLIML